MNFLQFEPDPKFQTATLIYSKRFDQSNALNKFEFTVFVNISLLSH